MRDQSSFWAAIVTAVIWTAVAGISAMFLIMMRPDAILAALFVAALAGIGVGGTHVIWDNIVKLRKITLEAELRRRDDDDHRGKAAFQAKTKRERNGRDRLGRLIETLDDDEVIELESLLRSRGVEEFD